MVLIFENIIDRVIVIPLTSVEIQPFYDRSTWKGISRDIIYFIPFKC